MLLMDYFFFEKNFIDTFYDQIRVLYMYICVCGMIIRNVKEGKEKRFWR